MKTVLIVALVLVGSTAWQKIQAEPPTAKEQLCETQRVVLNGMDDVILESWHRRPKFSPQHEFDLEILDACRNLVERGDREDCAEQEERAAVDEVGVPQVVRVDWLVNQLDHLLAALGTLQRTANALGYDCA